VADRLLALAVCAICSSLVVTGCHGSSGGPTGPGRPATNAASAPLLPAGTAALPSFDFATYERLLYQLRGTPVVVNLWASWCGPCRSETPLLVAAAKRYGDAVQFLGVDYQDERGAGAAFIGSQSVPYPNLFDESGDIHTQLGFVGLPDTIFYAADGTISATWSGPLTAQALRTQLDRIVREG
jgi:cytochrome c biogenesis protein CcmG, thiol:disulfide interchange protein DsbE